MGAKASTVADGYRGKLGPRSDLALNPSYVHTGTARILHGIGNPTIPRGGLPAIYGERQGFCNSMTALMLAALACAIWLYLLVGRGGFWLARERERGELPPPAAWPKVAIVVPARDEAEGIGASMASLVRQDYRGEWSIVLIDDGSSDGTAAIARQAAVDCGAAARLEVIAGKPLPAGW